MSATTCPAWCVEHVAYDDGGVAHVHNVRAGRYLTVVNKEGGPATVLLPQVEEPLFGDELAAALISILRASAMADPDALAAALVYSMGGPR